MIEVINKINETDLSPNEYFFLFADKYGVELKNIDVEEVKDSLRKKGYIKGEDHLDSSLVSKELEDKALLNRVVKFQRIFPPIVLPTGIHARGKVSQAKLKMRSFLQSYEYDWDIIYLAAERYVARYKASKYMYMQNAANFIIDKNGDSTLALECDTILYSEPEEDDGTTI